MCRQPWGPLQSWHHRGRCSATLSQPLPMEVRLAARKSHLLVQRRQCEGHGLHWKFLRPSSFLCHVLLCLSMFTMTVLWAMESKVPCGMRAGWCFLLSHKSLACVSFIHERGQNHMPGLRTLLLCTYLSPATTTQTAQVSLHSVERAHHRFVVTVHTTTS